MTSYKDFRQLQKKVFFSKTDLPLIFPEILEKVSYKSIRQYIVRIVSEHLKKRPDAIEYLQPTMLHSICKIVIGENQYIIRINKYSNLFTAHYFDIEHHVSAVLKQHHIPTCEVIATDCTRAIVDVDYQIRLYQKTLSLYQVYQQKNRDITYATEIGKLIACIHSIKTQGYGSFDILSLKKHTVKGILHTWDDYLHIHLDEHIEYCNNHNLLDRKIFARLKTCLNNTKLLSPITSPVLLHGDIANHNILVTDNKISAIIDWEDSISGDPLFDVAYYASGIYNNQDWLNSFIKGYIETRKIELNSDFWRSFWFYFVRISLSKLVIRHISDTFETAKPFVSNRLTYGFNKLTQFI